MVNQNEQVWEHVQHGDMQAFETVVRDYQNAVASVAFAGTGDVAGSEDIAQETFLVAWQSRNELRESSRLGGWLCGIARNLAKQWNRKRGAKKYAVADGEQADRAVDASPSPIQRVISAEEQLTVWNSLEKIPETYREVLVLFYRQSQSVAQVAAVLEISEENVRQRLSRGRNLLRAEVARTVEQTLEHSQPGPQFTVAVMASLGSFSTMAKSAGGAAAGSLAAKAVGIAIGSAAGKVALGSAAAGIAGGALGAAGGALGAAGGLGGAWLGTWLPAQLAPTMTERRLPEKNGRKLMTVSILFLFAIVAGTICFLTPGWWPVGILLQVVMSVAFAIIVTISSVRVNSEIKKIRQSIKPEDDPNPSWMRKKFDPGIKTQPSRWVGFRLVWLLPLAVVQSVIRQSEAELWDTTRSAEALLDITRREVARSQSKRRWEGLPFPQTKRLVEWQSGETGRLADLNWEPKPTGPRPTESSSRCRWLH